MGGGISKLMKKIFLSLIVILGFTGYAVYKQSLNTTPVKTTQSLVQTQAVGPYKNGKYTGDVADALYGSVQVEIIITNGQIAKVNFLQYPDDRHTSIEINTEAMPILEQETISAQDANVEAVSGATQTSRAFKESLQTALDQAK